MYYVYILFLVDSFFYIGFSKNLKQRLRQNQNGEVGFTSSKQPVKLVYYEKYNTKQEAIKREKQIKDWSRQKKINLIKNGHLKKD